MEKFLAELDNLRRLPGVENRTANSYHSIVNDIITCVQMNVIKNSGKDDVDYLMLKRFLVTLNKATWLNKIKPGFLLDEMKNINDDLLRYTKKLVNKLNDEDIDYNTNLEDANRIYSNLVQLSVLDEFI